MKKKTEFIQVFSNQACLSADKFNDSYEALLNVLIKIFNYEVKKYETL